MWNMAVLLVAGFFLALGFLLFSSLPIKGLGW
jgi:hypothetical protein